MADLSRGTCLCSAIERLKKGGYLLHFFCLVEQSLFDSSNAFFLLNIEHCQHRFPVSYTIRTSVRIRTAFSNPHRHQNGKERGQDEGEGDKGRWRVLCMNTSDTFEGNRLLNNVCVDLRKRRKSLKRTAARLRTMTPLRWRPS